MRIYLALAVYFSSAAAWAHGVSDADKGRIIEGGNFDFLVLGAKHMVTGYDHLLFLFGVIFFLTNFKDIVKFITAFTIGHSITLIAATFLEVTANEYLVDAVIALTVIYKGFDNIDGFERFLKMPSPNLLNLVFIFGLIHGFGLSTRLQQLPLGHEGLLLKILSFNVGVELGQVAALSVMALILASWRRTNSFSKFSHAANVALMLAGLALFVLQIANYTASHSHPAEPASTIIEQDHQDSHSSADEHNHDHDQENEHEAEHDHGHNHERDHMHPNEDGAEHFH